MLESLQDRIERQYRSRMAWYAHTAYTHHRACAAREQDKARAEEHLAKAVEALQEHNRWTGQALDAAVAPSATSAGRQPSQHNTQPE